MKKTKCFLCSILSSLSLLGFPSFSMAKDVDSKSEYKSGKIENKGVLEIKDIYDKKDKNNIFIDVREPFEWKDGTIPNVLKISLGNIPNEIGKLDKNKNYILVCKSGFRSSKAAKIMQKSGFKNLTSFNGGMSSWYQKGYTTSK